MYVCMYLYVFVCICMYMYVYMYVCMYMYVYVCICMYVYVYMYVYVHARPKITYTTALGLAPLSPKVWLEQLQRWAGADPSKAGHILTSGLWGTCMYVSMYVCMFVRPYVCMHAM